MRDDCAQDDSIERIRQAAFRVRADDAFKRSPVMSHLLEYLVDMTAQGVPLKSYAIAIEALGKSDSELADADTYARVAVARLRKALATYYAAHPSDVEIYIDTGSYEVLIRSHSSLDAATGTVQASPTDNWRKLLAHIRTFAWRNLAGGLAILMLAPAIYLYDAWSEQERWTTSDFPTLATGPVTAEEFGSTPAMERDAFKNALREKLQNYLGFRLIEAGDMRADYEIRLDLDLVGGAELETVALVETATQRVIWSSRYQVNDAADLDRSANLAATAMVAPGGALNRFGQTKRLPSRTPYGCWLRFTESVQSFSTMVDRELFRCAERWYAVNGSSPHAAFLRNWTLVSDSMTRIRPSARQAALHEALTVVNRALTRHPNIAMLHVAEMRTQSFLGERDMVSLAARNAIATARGNRVIAGMAGTWLAFWNDPQGAAVLAQLEDSPGISMPWEHAGHFIAAMMQDDVQGAGQHLRHLRLYLEGQPALNLLEAAYAGRSGRPLEAQAALDNLRNHPRAIFVGPEEIMERLPFAPEVKERLEEWISYQPT